MGPGAIIFVLSVVIPVMTIITISPAIVISIPAPAAGRLLPVGAAMTVIFGSDSAIGECGLPEYTG
jgi:hypothetical protein